MRPKRTSEEGDVPNGGGPSDETKEDREGTHLIPEQTQCRMEYRSK